MVSCKRHFKRHFVIPDTQVKEGVSLKHLEAAGNYIVEHTPEVVIHLGDHWDMPSLSGYDLGKKCYEGRAYKKDIEAGLVGMETLLKPINTYNKLLKKKKKALYKPSLIFLLGNHEQRIERAIETDRKLEGTFSYDDFQLDKFGFKVQPYLRPIDIDGILYAHYFINPDSAKKNVLGGSIEHRLRVIGQSFTMGHQQGYKPGMRYTNTGKIQRGIVAGSFYQHKELYMGEQGNYHWRGCLMKTEVRDGNYCLVELSLEYLLRNWM